MSVLIEGMEMPKSCGNCYMFSFLSDSCRITNHVYDELELANSYLTGWEAARAMQKIYQNAPTIIPASESKERPAFLPQYELTPRSEEGE